MDIKPDSGRQALEAKISRRSFGVAIAASIAGVKAAFAAGSTAKHLPGPSLKSPEWATARFPTSYLPAGGSNARRGEIMGSPSGGQHALTNLINAEFGLQAAERIFPTHRSNAHGGKGAMDGRTGAC